MILLLKILHFWHTIYEYTSYGKVARFYVLIMTEIKADSQGKIPTLPLDDESSALTDSATHLL